MPDRRVTEQRVNPQERSIGRAIAVGLLIGSLASWLRLVKAGAAVRFYF